MYNSRYSKVLTVTLIIVSIIIIALLIFWGVSVYRKYNVTVDASSGIDAFNSSLNNNSISTENDKNQITTSSSIGSIAIFNSGSSSFDESSGNVNSNQNSDGELLYENFVMKGYIEIPKTGIKYPILSETSLQALEKSICILTGPGLNEVGNTILVGHNYRNGLFFSDNAKLNTGDLVYITDSTGQTITYVIYKKYQTTPEDAEFASRDTGGTREITLSTCTDDSQDRIIILAREQGVTTQ